MNIIEIDNFSLKIKDKVLFNNVSLKIKEHSWLVLTGNIGSGKSYFVLFVNYIKINMRELLHIKIKI